MYYTSHLIDNIYLSLVICVTGAFVIEHHVLTTSRLKV